MAVSETRHALIHDWNTEGSEPSPGLAFAEVCDETLRDGLQSPSVRRPAVDEMLRLLHRMAALGIDAVNIGLPGAGAHVVASARRLAEEIRDAALPISPHCAARTLIQDIEPIHRISEEVGIPIEVGMFIGSSPIRMAVEQWDLAYLLKTSETALAYCHKRAMPVMFVTEDTTRTSPEVLRALYEQAIDMGARRLVVCDTCGHATPSGVRSLVHFIRRIASERGQPDLQLDWHGHQDRGLGVSNAIAAYEAGVNRIHATALGVGERSGNTPMDLLLVNLRLLGYIPVGRNLTGLMAYVRDASTFLGLEIPSNYPVVGRDAFETATGVHAAAVIKALRRGDPDLANLVYSGVPAHLFGLEQVIRVGPMSGRSNVVWWLERHGYAADDERVERVFRGAKASSHVLTEEELHTLAR